MSTTSGFLLFTGRPPFSTSILEKDLRSTGRKSTVKRTTKSKNKKIFTKVDSSYTMILKTLPSQHRINKDTKTDEKERLEFTTLIVYPS